MRYTFSKKIVGFFFFLFYAIHTYTFYYQSHIKLISKFSALDRNRTRLLLRLGDSWRLRHSDYHQKLTRIEMYKM